MRNRAACCFGFSTPLAAVVVTIPRRPRLLGRNVPLCESVRRWLWWRLPLAKLMVGAAISASRRAYFDLRDSAAATSFCHSPGTDRLVAHDVQSHDGATVQQV